MRTPTLPIQTLKGRESPDRAALMQRRFYQAWQRQGQGLSHRRIVLKAVDWVLVGCLTLCVAAIGFGLDRMYPLVRPSLNHALHEDLPVRPFPDCADAHEAGVFDIPTGSAAYTIDQDPDHDGLACERS